MLADPIFVITHQKKVGTNKQYSIKINTNKQYSTRIIYNKLVLSELDYFITPEDLETNLLMRSPFTSKHLKPQNLKREAGRGRSF